MSLLPSLIDGFIISHLHSFYLTLKSLNRTAISVEEGQIIFVTVCHVAMTVILNTTHSYPYLYHILPSSQRIGTQVTKGMRERE